MLFFRKGFTLLEIIIVLALTALFIATTSYMNRDVRTYQTNAERLANHVDTSIRNAKSSMTLGRGVMSGSTLVTTDKRTISIRGTGITTTYGTTNTGTENSLTWPFYDSDTAYQITDMSVSSGILMNGQMPIWDQTGVTMADITILPNGDFQIFSSSVVTPIRILRITAGYAGFERSIMVDGIMARTTSVQGKGEMDYIPAPPAPPPNSCAATPSFVNIGTTNVGSPTTAGQGWYYSTTPGNCSYDCTGGFKGASCLTPPTPSCDTNPAFPNLGALSTGSPSSVGQAWYYSATPGNCTYACNNGYTGNNCLTAPVNGCAANPTYPNIGTPSIGSPSSWNQAWSYNVTPGTCTYDCTGGYSGPSCATAPFVTNFTTTWKVGTPGYGNGDNIMRFSVWQNASSVVDWGDGTIEPITTGTPSHFYLTPGDYTIVMSNITYFGAESYSANYHGKLISVDSWGGITWGSMMSMFANADNLISLPAASPNTTGVTSMYGMFINTKAFNPAVLNLDTSHVTNMSSMFAGASIFNGSLASFDTSNVTNMSDMFSWASAFNKPISNFNTSNVTSIYGMFMMASAFNQSVASFDMSHITNMSLMFHGATVFNQPLTNFDTSLVTDMTNMFTITNAFNQPLTSFNTSNVTSMANMFWMASAFNQPLTSFNTSNVTNMHGMFGGATNFNQSVSNFNTSNVTDMKSMFYGTPFNQSVSNFNTSNVADMSGMFGYTSAFNQSVSSFDTSKVTDMSVMFYHNSTFNQSLANFNTSNVTSMSWMFTDNTAFNQSVANFDTSKVTNMDYMFHGATAFNQDISNWCVTLISSKPTNFDFGTPIGFTNNAAKQPQWGTCPAAPVVGFTTTWKVGTPGYGNGDNTVSFNVIRLAGSMIDWGDGTIEPLTINNPSHTYAIAGDKIIKISNITAFRNLINNNNSLGKLTIVNDWGGIGWTSMYFMFAYADHLNQLPIGAPNMMNVTSTYGMFYRNLLFNQSVANFNTSNVTDMGWMFTEASAFNQSVASFDTSNVTNMSLMFQSSAFSQSVANFDTSKVIYMGGMFSTTPFNQSVSNFNTSNVTDMNGMFNATPFNQSVANFDTTKVTNMTLMFAHNVVFNQSLANFNTSNVLLMQSMFEGDTAFNQPLSNFDTTKVMSMMGMFNGAASFNQDISGWCVSLIGSKPSYFDSSVFTSFANNAMVQPQWGTCP